MNKSVLALSTALSIFAFTPAFAQSEQAPAIDCTIAANAADPACANQQNNATGTQTQDTMGTTTDQNAQSGTGTGTGATTTTGSGGDAAGQGTAQGGSTDMNADQNAQGTTTIITPEQNAEGATTIITPEQNAEGATTTTPIDQNAQGTTTIVTPEQNAQSTTETTGTSTQQMSGGDLIIPADQLNSAQLMSASDYIGKTVYDQSGANIGEVNDMIISGDGNVEAVILGVGGFLGIGEKDVAVNTNAIQMVQDGDAQRLVVQATKETLEAAPTYDRANRRYAGDQMNTTTGTAVDTTTGSTTAPATTNDTTTGNTGGMVDCTIAANASDPACVNQQNQQQ